MAALSIYFQNKEIVRWLLSTRRLPISRLIMKQLELALLC